MASGGRFVFRVSAGAEKSVRSRQERCVLRPGSPSRGRARAIRRANRAGADTRLRVQDTRELGSRRSGESGDGRNGTRWNETRRRDDMQDAGGRSFARTGPPPQISSPARGLLDSHIAPDVPSRPFPSSRVAAPAAYRGTAARGSGQSLRYAPAGAVATQDEGKGLAAKGAKARAARPAGAPQTSRNEMCACGSARGRGRERASGRAAWQSPGRAKDGLPPRPPDRSPGQALPRKRGEGGKSGRLHARRDNRICAMRMLNMTSHDPKSGG